MRDRGAAWLLAGFLALAIFAATRTTLWDRDEARFGEAAGEMAASGNFLYPTFNGALRADKPILPYWVMAAAIRLFGRSAIAVRAGACLAAAAAAAATAATARRLLPAGSGFWAAAILVSSPLFLLEACAATADAMLLAGVAAAMLGFTRLVQGERGAALFGGGTAAAALAKGPVGFLLPALGAAAALAIAGPALAGRRRIAALSAAALAGALLLFAVWFIPADAATGGRYLAEGLGRHVVGRVLRPMEGHGGRFLVSLPYYLPVVLFGFSPGLLFLPAAASAAAGGRIAGASGRAILLGWSVPAFLFFSVAATKLPHYLLPVFPALAIAVAGTLAADRAGTLSARDRLWLRRGAALMAAVAAAEAAALVGLSIRFPAFAVAGIALAAVVAVASAGAWRAFRAARIRSAAAILTAGAAAAALLVAAAILPALERTKPVPRVVGRIREVAPSAPAATYAFEEPSLDFLLARPPVERLRDPADVARWARRPGPGLLVTTRDALRRLGAPPPLVEIASAHGWNVARGAAVEVVALVRPVR